MGLEPDQETQILYDSILTGQLDQEVGRASERAIRGYEVRERLGAGSFGVVYRAYQPAVKRDVAVKIIRPGATTAPRPWPPLFARSWPWLRRLMDRIARPEGRPDGDGASRLLAVVGPSGSGKSSVVKAGLIPALRRGALPGSEQWFSTEMVPGAHPFEELETVLLQVAAGPQADLLDELRLGPLGLPQALERLLPDPDSRRRISQAELAGWHAAKVPGASQALAGVLSQYGRYRLLTFDRDPQTREPTVEIAHEALLREWPRLKQWLEAT